MKDSNKQLTENRVANPAGVFHPADASHVKYAGKAKPIINKSAANQAAGVQPGRDSLMSAEKYVNGDYAKDIKKDSPDRDRR
jgi:hypothetical protein